jgi:hypothetical protein
MTSFFHYVIKVFAIIDGNVLIGDEINPLHVVIG